MTSTHFRSSRQDLKRGFSLIEVAIALAIFVIGALAIIRIFPGALSVINNNGDQLAANNLNRSTVAALKSENAVPDATFNLQRDITTKQLVWSSSKVDHSSEWVDIAASVAGVPRLNNGLPINATVAAADTDSALSNFHAIQAEPETVVSIDGNLSVLTRFPIAKNGTDPTTALPFAPVISRDIVLEGVRVKADGKLDFTDAKKEDDTAIATAEFTPESLLYVSYQYKDAASNVWGIKQEAVALPTAAGGGVDFSNIKVNPPTSGVGMIATASSVIAGPVNVTLRQYLGAGEFTPPSNIEKVADGRRGLVKLPTPPTGIAPAAAGDAVKVDYVADWSFLLHEGVPALAPEPDDSGALPPVGYRQIALGAPFIEDQVDVGIYSLLVQPSGTASRSAFGTLNPDPTVSGGGLITPTEDDLRAGRVTFNLPSSDTKARIVYQTRDNWAQQLSIAAMSYKPYVLGNPEPWRDYVIGTDNYIYFHAGEAGKAVTLSYTTGASPVVSRSYVIEDSLINTPGGVGIPAGFASSGSVARLQLTDTTGAALSGYALRGVRGTSVTVRSAYLNGDRYTQSLLTSNRSVVQ